MSASIETVIAAVRDHLEDTHINYSLEDDIFSFGIGLDSDMSRVDVKIHCRPNVITVYAIAPLKVRERVRDKVMSFITYANYGLRRGNFEMDLNDGEVRYKNAYFIGAEGPTELEILAAVSTPMLMMNKYGDGLIRVMFCDADPQAACFACEL